MVEAEQLELPVPRAVNGQLTDEPAIVDRVLDRLERIRPAAMAEDAATAAQVEMSFSQLHDFELCPVRYRFAHVWRLPAPPDELQPAHVRAAGSTELGASVHEALAAWHISGGDLLDLYRGPESEAAMLERYQRDPSGGARTLRSRAGFNMAVGDAVRGPGRPDLRA